MTNAAIVQRYRDALVLGDKIAQSRFQSALILKNQGRVKRIVAGVYQPADKDDLDDAMQAGSLGLLRALEDYDPARSSFSTYAAHWIRDHIQRWAGK